MLSCLVRTLFPQDFVPPPTDVFIGIPFSHGQLVLGLQSMDFGLLTEGSIYHASNSPSLRGLTEAFLTHRDVGVIGTLLNTVLGPSWGAAPFLHQSTIPEAGERVSCQ